MKKVSFIKGWLYDFDDFLYLPEEVQNTYFKGIAGLMKDYLCTESFTAEITVKIVPYEPLV